MSQDKEKLPPAVLAFNCHAVNLKPPQGGSANWVGDCPLCDKVDHLYLDPESSKWDCKVCGESGNLVTFLTKVSKRWNDETPKEKWRELAKDRRLPVTILKARGMGHDGARWLIPGKSPTGTVHDIRRYDGQKLMSTAGCRSQLFGMEKLANTKPGTKVWLCEGEWDAMAMDWLLRECQAKDDVVVAVPGAGVMKPEWLDYFRGKNVVAVYDADAAGDKGAAKALKSLKGRARKLQFVCWPQLKREGYDLRDYVTDSLCDEAVEPHDAMKGLTELIRDKPRAMNSIELEQAGDDKPAAEEAIVPITFDELVAAFSKHLVMSADMIDCLRVCCATVLSQDIEGDPLWVYIVGSPSAGKTLILSAFSGCDRCVFRSSITAHSLVSGWANKGANDPSLIPTLAGLTLVAKDFTEILSLPLTEQDQIYSALRGAYDGSVNKTFGNGVTREYDNCYFSIMAGVTHAIHGSNRATLGERFIKFQMKQMTESHIEEVILAAINNVGQERKIEDELKTAVKRYMANKIPADDCPLMQEEFTHRAVALVQLIASLRAHAERDNRTNEISVRPVAEYGTRLSKQLTKLAMGIAFTYGEGVVEERTWTLVDRVGFDTAYGFNYDIVDAVMRLGNCATRRDIALAAKIPSTTITRRFEELTMMEIIEPIPQSKPRSTHAGGAPAVLYRVTDRIAKLWVKSKGTSWTPPEPKLELPKPAVRYKPSQRGLVQRNPVSSAMRRLVMQKRSAPLS